MTAIASGSDDDIVIIPAATASRRRRRVGYARYRIPMYAMESEDDSAISEIDLCDSDDETVLLEDAPDMDPRTHPLPDRLRPYRGWVGFLEQFGDHLTFGPFEDMLIPQPRPIIPPPKTLLGKLAVTRIRTSSEAASLGSCPVCLEPYKPRMTLRLLPGCGHMVHKPCMDKWIERCTPGRYTCPLDNTSVSVPQSPITNINRRSTRSRGFRNRQN